MNRPKPKDPIFDFARAVKFTLDDQDARLSAFDSWYESDAPEQVRQMDYAFALAKFLRKLELAQIMPAADGVFKRAAAAFPSTKPPKSASMPRFASKPDSCVHDILRLGWAAQQIVGPNHAFPMASHAVAYILDVDPKTAWHIMDMLCNLGIWKCRRRGKSSPLAREANLYEFVDFNQ